MIDKYIVLNNGVKIPQFGLGTWFIDDDKAADAVKAAAEMGYRHKELWDSKRRNVCCIEGCC